MKRSSNRTRATILAVIVLDAAGTGLVLPVLPRLLESVSGMRDLGWRYGAFLSLYAALQFLASPMLGALSDRCGRRPVLLASLAGGVIDYGFMAWAPGFWWLFVGRAISGLTAANAAVAAACLTDITPEDRRARGFGLLSAGYGVGFVLGPAIGGICGAWSIRAPFVAAGLLLLANFLMALVALPETRIVAPAGAREGEGADAASIEPLSFHPLAPLRAIGAYGALLPLLSLFVIVTIVGEIGGTVWVFFGEDRFGWDTTTVGISLAAFGLFHAVAQAFLAGPVSERWGEHAMLAAAIVCDGLAYAILAFTSSGFVAFSLYPLFCVGGMAHAALQSMISRGAGDEDQGRLQGVLASLTSVASIVTPLAVSEIYFASRETFPGLVWLIGVGLYVGGVPILVGDWRRERAGAPSGGRRPAQSFGSGGLHPARQPGEDGVQEPGAEEDGERDAGDDPLPVGGQRRPPDR